VGREKEMDPGEPVRPPGFRGQGSGIQAGCVAGQDNFRGGEFIQPVKQLSFQGDIFAD
jgi:hypothetical protein